MRINLPPNDLVWRRGGERWRREDSVLIGKSAKTRYFGYIKQGLYLVTEMERVRTAQAPANHYYKASTAWWACGHDPEELYQRKVRCPVTGSGHRFSCDSVEKNTFLNKGIINLRDCYINMLQTSVWWSFWKCHCSLWLLCAWLDHTRVVDGRWAHLDRRPLGGSAWFSPLCVAFGCHTPLCRGQLSAQTAAGEEELAGWISSRGFAWEAEPIL